MMQRHSEAQASQDRAIPAQPFLAERDRHAERAWVDLQQRAESAALMQVDDDVRERLHAPSLGTKDQDSLPVFNEPPRCRETEFALIAWKESGPQALGREEKRRRGPGQEALHPRPLVADAQI
jgi:hypothetical protein